jgi:hypothetical protein
MGTAQFILVFRLDYVQKAEKNHCQGYQLAFI